jgi:hypothetical protein
LKGRAPPKPAKRWSKTAELQNRVAEHPTLCAVKHEKISSSAANFLMNVVGT